MPTQTQLLQRRSLSRGLQLSLARLTPTEREAIVYNLKQAVVERPLTAKPRDKFNLERQP